MTKYRILEKKGRYVCLCAENELFHDCKHVALEHNNFDYIPRYIVQKEVYHSGNLYRGKCVEHRAANCLDWVDLQEFSVLEEARKYKNDLELEEGRVVE